MLYLPHIKYLYTTFLWKIAYQNLKSVSFRQKVVSMKHDEKIFLCMDLYPLLFGCVSISPSFSFSDYNWNLLRSWGYFSESGILSHFSWIYL